MSSNVVHNAATAPWFFTRLPAFSGEVTLDDAVLCHHLKTVMRLRPGEPLVLVDENTATAYDGQFLGADKNGVRIAVGPIRATASPSAQPDCIAAVSLIKGDRWDWMLQKLTELGVSHIIPLRTERTVVDGAISENKRARWQQIIRQAAQQSERLTLPVLHPAAIPLTELKQIPIYDNAYKLAPVERAGGSFLTALVAKLPTQGTLFVIGPEGGWTAAERAFFENEKFIEISLGGRVLRSETAALYCAAVIRHASLG